MADAEAEEVPGGALDDTYAAHDGMLCDQPLDEPYTRLHDEVSAGGDDEAGYRRPDRLDYELERDLPGGWRDAQPDWGRYVRQADSLPLADRQPPQRRRDPLPTYADTEPPEAAEPVSADEAAQAADDTSVHSSAPAGDGRKSRFPTL